MKNIVGFIALITLLSGCGSSVENWICESEDKEFRRYMTIDFENKTWKDGDVIRVFNKNGNKISYIEESPFKTLKGQMNQQKLDIETGEYTTQRVDGLFTPQITVAICSKQ